MWGVGSLVETLVLLAGAAFGRLVSDELDMDEHRPPPFGVRDLPETVFPPEPVAGNREGVDLRRSDLVVTIRIPDLEDLGSHRTSPRSLDRLDARPIASINPMNLSPFRHRRVTTRRLPSTLCACSTSYCPSAARSATCPATRSARPVAPR